MSEVLSYENGFSESSSAVETSALSLYKRAMARVAGYFDSPIRGQSPAEALASQYDGVGDYVAQRFPTDIQTAESWALEYALPTPPARHAKPD